MNKLFDFLIAFSGQIWCRFPHKVDRVHLISFINLICISLIDRLSLTTTLTVQLGTQVIYAFHAGRTDIIWQEIRANFIWTTDMSTLLSPETIWPRKILTFIGNFSVNSYKRKLVSLEKNGLTWLSLSILNLFMGTKFKHSSQFKTKIGISLRKSMSVRWPTREKTVYNYNI